MKRVIKSFGHRLVDGGGQPLRMGQRVPIGRIKDAARVITGCPIIPRSREQKERGESVVLRLGPFLVNTTSDTIHAKWVKEKP